MTAAREDTGSCSNSPAVNWITISGEDTGSCSNSPAVNWITISGEDTGSCSNSPAVNWITISGEDTGEDTGSCSNSPAVNLITISGEDTSLAPGYLDYYIRRGHQPSTRGTYQERTPAQHQATLFNISEEPIRRGHQPSTSLLCFMYQRKLSGEDTSLAPGYLVLYIRGTYQERTPAQYQSTLFYVSEETIRRGHQPSTRLPCLIYQRKLSGEDTSLVPD
ncbi:hypothetical protein RRG08_009305 [Elysia crispata]|uniref:Uncharacterized protein n=1 Tax=Elysia crispata TaxID=231223 RepID=A0AAE1CL04_9GAST|nr:hypothetical protein RRG08_009305 [Elysia crispata]